MAHQEEEDAYRYNSYSSAHEQELAADYDDRIMQSSPSQQSSPQLRPPTRRERLDRLSRRLRTEFHMEHQQQQQQQYESVRQTQQFHDDEEKKSDSSAPLSRINDEDDSTASHQQDPSDLIRRPQHLARTEMSCHTGDDNCRYYRIIYRGVVALLSQPAHGSPRSGCYLSYGEVIKSACKIPMKHQNSVGDDNPQEAWAAIRVDEVLTGGYAFDPPDPSNNNLTTQGNSETPRRSNVQHYLAATAVSAEMSSPSITFAVSHSSSSDDDDVGTTLDQLRASSNTVRCEHNHVSHQGFVFSHNKNKKPILELLAGPPQCEHGRFFYKIISATPLPILSGASTDAPFTKAMVLPGTVHEVSFRMKISDETDDETWFLRLARRNGYLASHHRTSRQQQHRGTKSSVPLVKDVTEEINASASEQQASIGGEDATYVSVLSALSISVPFSTARNPNQRHRPPRRQRQTSQAERRPMHHLGVSAIAAKTKAHNHSYQQNNNHHHDSTLTGLAQSHSSDRLHTPSSNVSLLSDDSCLVVDQHTSFGPNNENNQQDNPRGPLSPDRSVARSIKSNLSFPQPQLHSTFYLMRVAAPRGLRILDAPHFQVNNLIHGPQQQQPQSQQQSHDLGGLQGTKGHQHHLFQTMAGRIATSNPAENTVMFDSVTKTRILPRGAVFEASKRMETSDALFHQGAGLIKLADNSGWVIVPHREELEYQYRSSNEGGAVRAYEEIGNAIVFGDATTDVWMRVVARAGAHIACAPPPPQLQNDDSNSSSPVSPPTSPNTTGDQQLDVSKSDSASDVASSVGSSFLDAMFRLPKRPEASDRGNALDKGKDAANAEKPLPTSNTIPCGSCVRVEPQIPSEHHQSAPQEYARLRGGQGWLPLFTGGKPTCLVCPRRNPPNSRFGSFWFRVQSKRGIKVRLGPSKRAPSIKSADGIYFRFECGEFLRASEVMTVYYDDSHGRTMSESFAKLYRNRHVRLNAAALGEGDYRGLTSLTAQAEWVQIHDDDKNEQLLHECTTGPPRIERHKQGWRYNVVASSGIVIRKGPSFEAEASDMYVAHEESVVISERVTSPAEHGVTWLRLKEGQGWLHDIDRDTRENVLIPHSFRHRAMVTNGRPSKSRRPEGHQDDKHQQIAYNTIIARLFHNDLPHDP